MHRHYVDDQSLRNAYAFCLPNGKVVSLAAYLFAWRVVKQDPDVSYSGFFDEPRPAREILAEFRRGVNDRINRKLPWWNQGRKWQ